MATLDIKIIKISNWNISPNSRDKHKMSEFNFNTKEKK